MRELDGDGTSGAYLDATDLGLIQEHNLYPLFKFGGPALFRVGSTSYDPGLTEALKLMGEGDSMQFFMASALSNTNDQKAKVVTVRLLRVLEDISEVDGQQVAASLDTITEDILQCLSGMTDKDIREYMYMSHLQQGSGAYPVPGDTVDIRYTGRFFNGSVFDP
jgi:FKBP-type peptidyl-prolyl cis-trans isomerase 2